MDRIKMAHIQIRNWRSSQWGQNYCVGSISIVSKAVSSMSLSVTLTFTELLKGLPDL